MKSKYHKNRQHRYLWSWAICTGKNWVDGHVGHPLTPVTISMDEIKREWTSRERSHLTSHKRHNLWGLDRYTREGSTFLKHYSPIFFLVDFLLTRRCWTVLALPTMQR